jgi:hypothetical protein
MLMSGIQLSKGVERNQSFYLMSFANLIGFLGTGLVLIALIAFGTQPLKEYFFGGIFFLASRCYVSPFTLGLFEKEYPRSLS